MICFNDSEFLLSLDMRFASKERAFLGQLEVSIGLIPGGGATQRLPELLGRGRALEVILSAQDYTAEQAASYGWVNQALPSADLRPYVERLAFRIATFPPDALRAAKQAIDAAGLLFYDGLREEAYLFAQARTSPEGVRRMKRFLAGRGQTRSGELSLDWVVGELAE